MELNWTVVTYIVVGLFVLNGFYRGWWKEAITTGLLVILVFLLQQPGVAEAFINIINNLLAAIWELLPESLRLFLANILESGLGIRTAGGPIQADASQPGTWLLLLVIFVGLAVLFSRLSLPDYGNRAGYAVTPMGGILGGLVGGLNGFIIINLVREYLDGRSLPAGLGGPSTEIAQSFGGQPIVGMAASGPSIQATELPNLTILDSFVPWVIIVLGFIILIIAIRNRVRLATTPGGFRRIEYVEPYGYRRYG